MGLKNAIMMINFYHFDTSLEWGIKKKHGLVIQSDVFIPDRWRSLNPWKGYFTIPKRSPAELPREMFFPIFNCFSMIVLQCGEKRSLQKRWEMGKLLPLSNLSSERKTHIEKLNIHLQLPGNRKPTSFKMFLSCIEMVTRSANGQPFI